MGNLGRILFIVGLIVAVAAGLGFSQPWLPWALAVLGAVVGFLNVSGGERNSFLIAGIAMLMSATAFSQVPGVGDEITSIMRALMSFLTGAIFIVALLSLFDTARD